MPAGRGAPIARHDLADTAAAVLASDGAHDGETFDVTGRERLSLHDIAAAFSAASERRIVYVEETPEEALAARRGLGADDWLIDAWVGTDLAVARGELDIVSDTVARLAGHDAVSLAAFLRAHPESYAHMTPA